MSVKPTDRPEYAALVSEYMGMDPHDLVAEIVELTRLLRDEAAGGGRELAYHEYSEASDRLWVAAWAAAERGAYRLVRSA